MAFVPTLRRVLANLQDGLPAEAVRTDALVPASAVFRQRMRNQAATDAWLQTLLPALPARLHAALVECTNVREDTLPVATLPSLLLELTQCRDSLRAALDRAGLPRTAVEQAHLDDLAELLALLTRPVEPGAVSGEMHPPHPAEVQQAFADLAALVTAHLLAEVSAKAAANLVRRLKPGVAPQAALVAWARAHHGPKQRSLGLLLIDWKAREEIAWQAERMAMAHGVAGDWAHDWRTDTRWARWETRGELPVSAPLRSLAEHLQHQGAETAGGGGRRHRCGAARGQRRRRPAAACS